MAHAQTQTTRQACKLIRLARRQRFGRDEVMRPQHRKAKTPQCRRDYGRLQKCKDHGEGRTSSKRSGCEGLAFWWRPAARLSSSSFRARLDRPRPPATPGTIAFATICILSIDLPSRKMAPGTCKSIPFKRYLLPQRASSRRIEPEPPHPPSGHSLAHANV